MKYLLCLSLEQVDFHKKSAADHPRSRVGRHQAEAPDTAKRLGDGCRTYSQCGVEQFRFRVVCFWFLLNSGILCSINCYVHVVVSVGSARIFVAQIEKAKTH